MYLGIDLGTSGIKVVLVDDAGQVVDSQTAPLSVQRPAPLWSEQNPNEWWQGFCQAMDQLAKTNNLAQVSAIGLAGQMHGATLLDKDNNIIRPAILWNDGRCAEQCIELEKLVPDSRKITGNIMMPGFTAPKLLWVKQHEPEHFTQINKVLLPKDYLRYMLTGQFACDMSDASGTLWLDVEKRQWHAGLLSACGLSEAQMPELLEGNQVSGYLHDELASRWNMQSVPVIAGGGDNAAGAIGLGMIKPGQAMLSLGTSGVYFVVTDGYLSNPDSAVHSFCHALPKTWHLMSVLLSAASCLQWFADNIADKEVAELLAALDKADIDLSGSPYFLPYLSGERTPHNNPNAQGCFFGLTHESDQALLTHGLMEGVSFAFADGVDAITQTGVEATEITLIGGGARSPYWRQMLADILNKPLTFRQGGDVGPALGAARLAALATNVDVALESICPVPEIVKIHHPDLARAKLYAERRETYRALYKQLKPLFNRGS